MTAGVRQGAISSGIFFNLYCDRLIRRIRRIGTGCRIGGGGGGAAANIGGEEHNGGGEFFGICVYCDDIFLLSASRAGLQSMMNVCQSFASANNLQFSVNADPIKSKSKCIIFSKHAADRTGVAPILLNGVPLPWVSKLRHLGHTLDCNNSMTLDTNEKKGIYIGKVNSLLQEFYFASPNVLMDLIVKYACSFYGSCTWNLFNNDSQKVYNSFNISVRHAFKLPWSCHRYFVEPIANVPHLKTLLCSRFVNFVNNNDKCNKPIIRLLSSLCKNDNRTVYCKNLTNISRECDLSINDVCSRSVKERMKFANIPEGHEWTIDLLLNLLSIKFDNWYLEDFNFDEINAMIYFVSTV